MAVYQVTLIPGDGIGPEIAEAMKAVVKATGVCIEWDEQYAGVGALERCGGVLPNKTLESIKRNTVAIKGPTATPVGTGHRSINVALRKYFDLYANVRPVESWPHVPSHFNGIDIVMFRENTEDLYIGEERWVEHNHVAEAISRITYEGSRRIAKYAFEYCRRFQRKQVTVVHKANIMKLTHGLFLDTFREVAAEFPDIVSKEMIADNFMMQLVRNPRQFDCIVLPNFLGDLASDLCAGLVGGLGFAPGANIGSKYAIFEAVHGTAPDIAGKGIANPTALILSSALMLGYLGEYTAARKIKYAVRKILGDGICRTADLDPERAVSTMHFAGVIASMISHRYKDIP